MFRGNPNYIKEVQFVCESFIIERDKKFHVEIRVFLRTYLYIFIYFQFVIIIISQNDEKDNLKFYF